MKMQIHPLQSHHDTETFCCGNDALDGWLRQTAKQHIRKGISRTYVAVAPGSPERILGFYCLTVGEAETDTLPSRIAKNLPRTIPVVLLGRLAVATEAKGEGIGGLLLVDALHRTVRVASEVGISVILVDAKDQNAVSFYQHFGFQTLPEASHRLVLPVQTAVSLLST